MNYSLKINSILVLFLLMAAAFLVWLAFVDFKLICVSALLFSAAARLTVMVQFVFRIRKNSDT